MFLENHSHHSPSWHPKTALLAGTVPCPHVFLSCNTSPDEQARLQLMKAMDVVEPSVPPGFRFHPTDEELVGYYLRKKIASEKIDLEVIRDIDLYRIEPWDLQDRCRIGYEEQNEWYFFSHKDKKYPTGTRTNRATLAGFWKATGRDKAVHDKNRLIGMRKTLVFYKGRAPNGQKTDWIMHEYRLESEENAPPQEEGWVVCRAFKKRTPNCQIRATEAWDLTFCSYDDPTTAFSSIAGVHADYRLPRPQPQPQPPASFICKQESKLDHLVFLRANQFVQLPQLESPSLPSAAKRQAQLPAAPAEAGEEEQVLKGVAAGEKVTDWRALDRFVASQLSPEDRFDGHDDSELALLLLQNGGEGEESKQLDGFLGSSSPEFDIGICLFEK